MKTIEIEYRPRLLEFTDPVFTDIEKPELERAARRLLGSISRRIEKKIINAVLGNAATNHTEDCTAAVSGVERSFGGLPAFEIKPFKFEQRTFSPISNYGVGLKLASPCLAITVDCGEDYAQPKLRGSKTERERWIAKSRCAVENYKRARTNRRKSYWVSVAEKWAAKCLCAGFQH